MLRKLSRGILYKSEKTSVRWRGSEKRTRSHYMVKYDRERGISSTITTGRFYGKRGKGVTGGRLDGTRSNLPWKRNYVGRRIYE